MAQRAVEDWLREEYFDLLPDMRRVAEELEAEVRHCLLPISHRLEKFERLIVKSRIKECESAVDALRRRQEGRTFDQDRAELYSLKSLNDLAGVRVLVFPRSRGAEASAELRKRFPSWAGDPVSGSDDLLPLADKYYGYCSASEVVRGELQVVPLLTALFWEVEHAAIYKPSPRLVDLTRRPMMQQRVGDVLKALQAFDEEFEKLIRLDRLGEQ